MPQSAYRLPALQTEILEAIACGQPLAATMSLLCRRVEEIAPETICSVVAADAERRIQPLAAPSLPDSYTRAITGLASGPSVGSCGTVIHTGEPIEIGDIATDPHWDGFQDLVLPLGLAACWSSPIMAPDGRVLGAFAFYYRRKRSPSAIERRIVSTCVHLCAIAMAHDEVQEHNRRLAYYDTLTGLPNRASFNEVIARMIAGPDLDFALMLIDIDNLKTINDTLGHAAGDALITEVGRRLREQAGTGTTCRIGGDEFAILLPGVTRAAQIRTIASAIISAMTQPLDHDGHGIATSVTIGTALAGEDGRDPVTLQQNADFALYHAKEHRRGGYVRFKAGLRTAIQRRMQLQTAVNDALANGRIVPHYQPIVRLDTDEIVGVEALARMYTPDGRLLTAGEFQDALLDPRIAYRITSQMLLAIAGDMAAWRAAGIHFQHVGLNVTTADFQKGDLVSRLSRVFERAEVPLQHLFVEVTERVFMGGRKDSVARTITSLRELGITVALDDFGTGFASLTHLLEFPVNVIKIDRSFVASIRSGARSGAIVDALTRIASRLDLNIIAEGIETQEQAECLQALGCQFGQGYLYSPAVPASIVTELLQRFGERPKLPRSGIAQDGFPTASAA